MNRPETEILTLRIAKTEDLEALQILYRNSIEDFCKKDYDAQQREIWKNGTENKQRWMNALQSQYFLVGEFHGQIVGFGSLENGNYIDFMYTAIGYQRLGVAQSIYDCLLIKAIQSGADAILADVSKTARSFFEKQGFTVVRENINVINGVEIPNFRMQKLLHNTQVKGSCT